jgi:hypothetical protein
MTRRARVLKQTPKPPKGANHRPLSRERVNEAVALGYVALRIVESTIIVIGLISLLAVVTLRQDFAGAGGDPGALGMAGQTLVTFHEWTRILGPQFCAGFGNGTWWAI